MERVRLEELRKDLGRWMRKAQRSRFIVTKRGFDFAAVCSIADLKRLEQMEEKGGPT